MLSATVDLDNVNSKGKQRAMPTVSVSVDDNEDEEEDQDMEADFAPGGDADYFIEEDEDGRFFGGGLSSTQKEILDIFEGQEAEDQASGTNAAPAAATVQSVRRQLLNLERAINKNAEMRVKWSGQPEK